VQNGIAVLNRLRLLIVGFAAILAAGAFGWTDQADASCGDYVVIGGQAGHDADSSVVGIQGAERPCHGPKCSKQQHDPLPTPAPAPPRVQSSQEYLCASQGGPSFWADHSVGELTDAAAGLPLYLAAGIFRPPCAG
jgi:hypothetical protein